MRRFDITEAAGFVRRRLFGSKRRTLITAAVVVVGLLCIFPSWSRTGKTYTCRLCGATRTKVTTRFLGIPVWMSRRYNERPVRDLYYRHIGKLHNHEWAGGPCSRDNGTLLGRSAHSDGYHVVPPFPAFQPRLTGMALTAVSQVQKWPQEQRIRLFEAILSCTSREDYEALTKTLEERDRPPTEVFWEVWLVRHEQQRQPDQQDH